MNLTSLQTESDHGAHPIQAARMLTRRTLALIVLAALAACYTIAQYKLQRIAAGIPAEASVMLREPANYAITSTAQEAQTRVVGEAVESLNTAYREFFAQTVGAGPGRKKLLLTLYSDQSEFKLHNKSAFWAEAYYLAPVCYACYAGDEKNPYH